MSNKHLREDAARKAFYLAKNKEIPLIRKLIDPDATLPEKMKETIYEMMLRLTGIDITCCPKCMKGKMFLEFF